MDPHHLRHDYIHALAATSRTLQQDELANLRTYGRESSEHQREQQRELGLYHDQGGAHELAQFHQHERSYEQDQEDQRQRQHSYDREW